jgi:hypothetical protein
MYAGDEGVIHSKMDDVLLLFIDDERVTEEYFKNVKWCT